MGQQYDTTRERLGVIQSALRADIPSTSKFRVALRSPEQKNTQVYILGIESGTTGAANEAVHWCNHHPNEGLCSYQY